MKNKFWFLIFSIALIPLGIYYQKNVAPKVAGVMYDKSIETIEGQPIRVLQAIDGDTAVLINGDRIRYIGIDTPEEFDARKPVQCFAKEAAVRNKELVDGKTIIFYKDVNQYDNYGRWLGFIYLEDGTFVNEKLVREGYAFAYPYPPDISKSEIFKTAEAYARENKLGLWGGQCEITKLKSGREQTNPVE
jgi:micrococcal nuclease